MAIRAKFKVMSVTTQGENEVVKMNAVYSADPDDPNHSWSKYTPWGELSMGITNPSAQGQLVQGEEFFIDFTKAE